MGYILIIINPVFPNVLQGRTEEFGEGGVRYEIDEGAGQEVTLSSPRNFLTSNVS